MASSSPAAVAYFTGEFLSARDYAQEQAYQLDLQRQGTAALDTCGVAHGLRATLNPDGRSVEVSAGIAIDPRGRLVVQDAVARIAVLRVDGQLPPQTDAWLMIRFREATAPDGAASPAYWLDGSELFWRPAIAKAPDKDDAIRLAKLHAATPATPSRLDNSSCINVAGMTVGTLAIHDPTAQTPERAGTATITGWNSSTDSTGWKPSTGASTWSTTNSGLRFDASTTVLKPFTAESPAPTLSISKGSLSAGTMSATAVVDVMGSNIAQSGPGTLTSYDHFVAYTDPDVADLVDIGTLIMVTDRQGMSRQAAVVKVTKDALITDRQLNCENAPFKFSWGLLASVASTSIASTRDPPITPIVSVDRSANVGLNIATPRSRLDISQGCLNLTGDDHRSIAFRGEGMLRNVEQTSRIAFKPDVRQMELRQNGPYQWLPGRPNPDADIHRDVPTGMILTGDGKLGIGLLKPQYALDVNGFIRSITGPQGEGGFIFPDGTMQTGQQTVLPVGSIIDWAGDPSADIPDNYQICNGSLVEDTNSPFHGQTVPNLSDLFVFGTPQQWPVPGSGPTENIGGPPVGADKHVHTYAVPSHTHPMPHTHPPPATASTGPPSGKPLGNDDHLGSDQAATTAHAHDYNLAVTQYQGATGANSDVNGSASTLAASLLPPCMSLLKLIRIK